MDHNVHDYVLPCLTQHSLNPNHTAGVNRIGDKSRLSATKKIETVLSSLKMR